MARQAFRRLSVDDQELVQQIWPEVTGSKCRHADYAKFLEYIHAEFAGLSISTLTSARETSVHVKVVRNNTAAPSATVLGLLKNSLRDAGKQDTQAERIAEFVARTWLSLTITISSSPADGLDRTSVTWPDNKSLQDVVGAKFELLKETNKLEEPAETDHIPRDFSMVRLVRDYRWTVRWTDSLADHLTIDWVHHFVVVYAHKVSLFNHSHVTTGSPIPRAAINEALDTFDLLFPPNDSDTQKFLYEQSHPIHELGFCGGCDYYQLSHYVYWRKSIAHLVGEMKAPPTGMRQLFLDTQGQNLYQFATFWLAAIVGVLTILSIVFGTVATVFAVKQYNLAVAQACSTPGAETALPQYCT